MNVNQLKSVHAWSEPSTWMGVQWLAMIEERLHALRERKNSSLEGRDIYRLQTLAGLTNASSAVVHLKLYLVFCSCYLDCSSSSHSFLLGNYQQKLFFHFKSQLKKKFNKLMFVWNISISSLDKALNSLGYKYGYVLTKPQLPNPINIVMVYAQKVLLSFIIIFFSFLYHFVLLLGFKISVTHFIHIFFRFFHWTIACLWPLFSTSFTVPCLGSEQLAYAAAGLEYPPSFSTNFYFTCACPFWGDSGEKLWPGKLGIVVGKTF